MSFREEICELYWLENQSIGIVDEIINKVCEACIQAITDNPHKSPIEAITDMRRKQANEPNGEI